MTAKDELTDKYEPTTKEIRTRYNTLVTEMTADEAWKITVRAHYGTDAVVSHIMKQVLLRAESGYSNLRTPTKNLEPYCPDEDSLLAVIDVISRLGYEVTLTDKAIAIKWKNKSRPTNPPTSPSPTTNPSPTNQTMGYLYIHKDAQMTYALTTQPHPQPTTHPQPSLFKPWPKIMRAENRKPNVFTEKIDGANACVAFNEDGTYHVQSRQLIITPNKDGLVTDNYGFAAWVEENLEDLRNLGVGYHFGEWYGKDIGRGYNLQSRHFVLFNSKRWGAHNPNTPTCCQVVPILPVTTEDEARQYLIEHGSSLVQGYMKPEGAIMLDINSDTYYKVIIDK